MDRPTIRQATSAAIVVGSLVVSTGIVALLQDGLGVDNPSSIYLLAVVLSAIVGGTGAAVFATVASFLLYNFLFVDPRYTLTVAEPSELVNLVLLLFVGIVVGQLAALQRARAEAAIAREREARALFGVSRVLATRASTGEALTVIAATIARHAGMARVWMTLGGDPATERLAADTESGGRPPAPGRVRVLQRMPGDEPARWTLVHRPAAGRGTSRDETYRVRIEASGDALGSIWAIRPRDAGEPDRTETRLLAAAADQIGQALARDRIADEARAAEVARQSDELKSSLLQSVSHDFRTPLAVIRAAAGSLESDAELSAADRRANAAAIEREVEYLNRLVANLLDLSRIEGGALRAELDAYELDDLVGHALDRARGRLGSRHLDVAVEPVVVTVDPVFLDAVLANVLDNALKYTPDGARIRVASLPPSTAGVVLRIEDDGPGVSPAALPRLFEKFYRAPGSRSGSRGGLGIGLAVVHGMVRAMGGRVIARPASLGGLAIDIELPLAPVPPEPPAVEPAEAGT